MKEMTADDERLARQVIGLLELFALNTDDTEQRIVGICRRACTPVGPVAAVSVQQRFVCLARTTLDRLQARHIKVVAVVNFPHGSSNVQSVIAQVRAALMAGADEIDVVYPFRALLGGDRQPGLAMISACSALCAGQVRLTATLETGDLRDSQMILDACRDAIVSGADFIKTSTGKAATHVTPQAARIMLESIADVGGQVGLKVAGGIRTFDEARVYMALVRARFGLQWISAGRLRLGGSSLLDDLLARLGLFESDGGGAGF
ncbi:deoxyribose-phosphate aldolase [Pseudomonas syringae]|uniref:deoxyribose-phosphate aldolase n=1 Tax=Pseudomonas syringae TaxID=317 RepID=UPI0002ADC197|nr:deoxyribose-phosphate aldolase [Pseudomonas syringae]ELS40566.1 Deoxyribose-phosphate aldolase [Pseudomonas syringae pv. syringae B64]KFF83414.1 deoxyribose-phosphate aldolase [Pseudomonas syringae pv. syringae]MBS7412374.1 deoxyribose-phosphate aldolase [Pseudomonas syringae]MBS7417393.1 deoxyribose-phosphate aldolase [Pseudomonas syringae]MBS7470159.1 deoxyribose-phosphate aldolase [Pseudomonas syringae]